MRWRDKLAILAIPELVIVYAVVRGAASGAVAPNGSGILFANTPSAKFCPMFRVEYVLISNDSIYCHPRLAIVNRQNFGFCKWVLFRFRRLAVDLRPLPRGRKLNRCLGKHHSGVEGIAGAIRLEVRQFSIATQSDIAIHTNLAGRRFA